MAYSDWHKSTRSGNQANCVAVRTDGVTVQVKDTKDPDGAVLTFGAGSWCSFIFAIKAGALDQTV